MSNKIKQLQNVMECSQLMLKDAEQGNWDKVIKIENQRSEILENLFSSSSKDNNVAGMDDKIRKIIDINAQLETIASNAREGARKEICAISKGRQAVNHYAENSI